MRNVYVSQRYRRPIAVGLLFCGLFGFALGQTLGHRPSVLPAAATLASHASGALGTPTSTSTTHTHTPATTSAAPASVVYIPAAYAPAAPPHPQHHHKDKSKHDGHGADKPAAHHNDHNDHKGHNGHNGD